jgi:hypothetical protein
MRRCSQSPEQIVAARAVHLSLTLQAGPRIDLFTYPEGKVSGDADMHPHIALWAAPKEPEDLKLMRTVLEKIILNLTNSE